MINLLTLQSEEQLCHLQVSDPQSEDDRSADFPLHLEACFQFAEVPILQLPTFQSGYSPGQLCGQPPCDAV